MVIREAKITDATTICRISSKDLGYDSGRRTTTAESRFKSR